MPSAQRKFGGVVLAPIAAFVLAFLLGSLPTTAASAQDLPNNDANSPNPAYLELEHHSTSEISPADAQIIREKQREIAAEAAFFAYDLNSSTWDYDLSVCPALPDQLLLHYSRQYRNGGESLFTALVPRGPGRVFVVPVLYHNATPFRSAAGSERSIAVFNRVVPADIAQQAIQPEGKWLSLALCYADIVYAHATALQRAGDDIGLVRAPLPTLRVSDQDALRQIIFTDRNAPGQYLVWTLALTDKGRITAANSVQLSDYVADTKEGKQPTVKPIQEPKEPPVKILPPAKEPPVKTVPQ